MPTFIMDVAFFLLDFVQLLKACFDSTDLSMSKCCKDQQNVTYHAFRKKSDEYGRFTGKNNLKKH